MPTSPLRASTSGDVSSSARSAREDILRHLCARRDLIASQLAREQQSPGTAEGTSTFTASTTTDSAEASMCDAPVLSNATLLPTARSSRAYSQIDQLPEIVVKDVGGSAASVSASTLPFSPLKGSCDVAAFPPPRTFRQKTVPNPLSFVSSISSDQSHDSSAPQSTTNAPQSASSQRNRQSVRQGVFAVIRAGSCVLLQTLLESGRCSVNVRDYQNCTPLHVAAHEGREDMALILLAYGADVFAIDDRNRTPRDVAVSNRHSGLGRFLLLEMKQALQGALPPASKDSENQTVSAAISSNVTTAGTARVLLDEDDDAPLAPPSTLPRGNATASNPRPKITLEPQQSNVAGGGLVPTVTHVEAPSRRRRKNPSGADDNVTRSLLDLDTSEGGRERIVATILAEAVKEEAAAEVERTERQRREQEEEDEKVRFDREEEEALRRPHHGRTLTPDAATAFAALTPTLAMQRADPSIPIMGYVSAVCGSCRPGWGQLSATSPSLGFSMSPTGKSDHSSSAPRLLASAVQGESEYILPGHMLTPCVCPNCFSHHVMPPLMVQHLSLASQSLSSTNVPEQQQQHIRNTSTNSDDVEIMIQGRVRSNSAMGYSLPVTFPMLPYNATPATATYMKYYQNSVFRTITDEQSLIICLVGLPGRGKSFISKRVSRYLNWKGVPCRIFNAGDYRRRILGAEGTAGAEFYDPRNEKAKEARDQMAHLAVEDMLKFISRNPVPAVGILDATNTTVSRRRLLLDTFRAHFGLVTEDGDPPSPRGGSTPPVTRRLDKARVIFIESVCNVQDIITENILRAKFGNDDFKGVQDPHTVVEEFRDRIKQYEKVYETIHEEEDDGRISFIKIIDVKQQIILHHVRRGLASKVSYFLMNLHPMAFPVFIVVPGETAGSAAGKFGGDENLTTTGKEFARKMRRFIKERVVVMQEATRRENQRPSEDSANVGVRSFSAKGAANMGLRILCATNPSARDTLKIATRAAPETRLVWVETRTTKGHRDPNLSHASESTSEDEVNPTSPVSSSDSDGRGGSNDDGDSSLFTTKRSTVAPVVSEPSPNRLPNRGSDLIKGVAVKHVRALDDLNYGVVANMSEGQIREKYPKLSSQLFIDSAATSGIQDCATLTSNTTTLNYAVSFPRGESCRMCNVRLESALFEIMRSNGPVMVIAPRVPAQGVMAFLTDVLPERSPQLQLPKHTVVEITTKGQVVIHHLL